MESSNLKYRPSLLNILSAIGLLYALGSMVFNYEDLNRGGGWGMLGVMTLAVISIAGIIIDLIFQILTRKLKPLNRHIFRNALGIILLASLYLYTLRDNPQITIYVSNEFDGAMSIVYGLPDTKKMPRNFWSRDANLNLPSTGIILVGDKSRNNRIPWIWFIRKNGDPINLSGVAVDTFLEKPHVLCTGDIISLKIINLGNRDDGEAKMQLKLTETISKINEIYCH